MSKLDSYINYRDISIFTQVDAGKTKTIERIVKLTGTIHKLGEVHEEEMPLQVSNYTFPRP